MVSVVILTFNEELNLPYAIESVRSFSDNVHIVDSGSTDQTLNIARNFNVNIHLHSWKNWADQRNWILGNCSLKYQWVLFLDADEQLTPESAEEIIMQTENASDDCVGFYLSFDFYFIGRRLRNAMHPHLRLVRKNEVRWDICGAREYCSAPSNSPVIKSRLIHHDHRGLKFWIKKQTQNAELEAKEKFYKRKNSSHRILAEQQPGELKFRHYLRNFIDTKCPLFIFPFLSFLYRLIFQTSIRDGWVSFVYAFFLGFWYPMMIELKCLKLYRRKTKPE